MGGQKARRLRRDSDHTMIFQLATKKEHGFLIALLSAGMVVFGVATPHP